MSLREKWLNTNEAVAYQKILRRTTKAPLAFGAEVQNGQGSTFTPRFHAFMACFRVKINFFIVNSNAFVIEVGSYSAEVNIGQKCQ